MRARDLNQRGTQQRLTSHRGEHVTCEMCKDSDVEVGKDANVIGWRDPFMLCTLAFALQIHGDDYSDDCQWAQCSKQTVDILPSPKSTCFWGPLLRMAIRVFLFQAQNTTSGCTYICARSRCRWMGCTTWHSTMSGSQRGVAAECLKNERLGPFFVNDVQGYDTKLTNSWKIIWE